MPSLSPTARRFILHWGEMGSRWGVNRSVAQVHALLYLSETTLSAEEIAETLSLARSNVSTSLKELQGWGIVRTVARLGDRREHFESLTDVWELFQIVMDERKRREIDPTLAMLRDCLDEIDRGRGHAHVRRRLESMLQFFETMSSFYGQVRKLPAPALLKFVRLGSRIPRMLAGAAR